MSHWIIHAGLGHSSLIFSFWWKLSFLVQVFELFYKQRHNYDLISMQFPSFQCGEIHLSSTGSLPLSIFYGWSEGSWSCGSSASSPCCMYCKPKSMIQDLPIIIMGCPQRSAKNISLSLSGMGQLIENVPGLSTFVQDFHVDVRTYCLTGLFLDWEEVYVHVLVQWFCFWR